MYRFEHSDTPYYRSVIYAAELVADQLVSATTPEERTKHILFLLAMGADMKKRGIIDATWELEDNNSGAN